MNTVTFKPNNIYFQSNTPRTKEKHSIARLQREVKVRNIGANILRTSGLAAALTGVFLPIETGNSFLSILFNNLTPISLDIAALFAIAGGVGLNKTAEIYKSQ